VQLLGLSRNYSYFSKFPSAAPNQLRCASYGNNILIAISLTSNVTFDKFQSLIKSLAAMINCTQTEADGYYASRMVPASMTDIREYFWCQTTGKTDNVVYETIADCIGAQLARDMYSLYNASVVSNNAMIQVKVLLGVGLTQKHFSSSKFPAAALGEGR